MNYKERKPYIAKRMNKFIKNILKTMSNDEFDLKKSRKFVEIKAIDPLKNFYETLDMYIKNEDYEIPVRIYFPDKENNPKSHIILYLHGGGFVSESLETYNRVCNNLSRQTQSIVISVDYRLAPEYKFPTGLMDCYTVVKSLYSGEILTGIDTNKVVLMGDSAGGNFAAALSLMTRDNREYLIKRQILLYPCTDNDYRENSIYISVRENGNDYLLTRDDLIHYMDLYMRSEKDKENGYFSPMKAEDVSNQPKTLMITAEFDPLRDEGEAYAKRLKDAGNTVVLHRIEDAVHGFFAYTTKFSYSKITIDYVNEFLNEDF